MPKRKTAKNKTVSKTDNKTIPKSKNASNLPVAEKKSKPDTKKPKKEEKLKKSTKKTEDVTIDSETPEEEEKIEAINPQNDIVETFNSDKDKEWGFGFEFSKESDFKDNWDKIKEKFEKNPEFEYKFSINWFTQDTEGFIPGEATKQYLIIWAWGFIVEKVKIYFDKLFPKIADAKRVYKMSEELSSDYWVDMPKKDQIIINGSEIIPLPKKSPRRITPIPDDIVKSVPEKISRYWSPKRLSRARDWLIPVISKKNYDNGEVKPEDYLEEYIVEQVDFEVLTDPKSKKMICIILPEEFNPNNELEKISIPERFASFNPGFDFGNLPGNFADMNLGK